MNTNGASELHFSVVVCTYNRVDDLRKCLEGFAKVKFPPERFEVIVVDNNSQDETRDLVERLRSNHSWLQYVLETEQGLSFARNRGIEESLGKIVIFTDDDAVPRPDFLLEMQKAFSAYPSALCVGGRIYPDFDVSPPSWFNTNYETQVSAYDMGDEPFVYEEQVGPFGTNMAFRRESFERAGRFDTTLGRKGNSLLSNEEIALVDKIKEIPEGCVYWPKAEVDHRVPEDRLTRKWMLSRFFWQGVSDGVMFSELKDAPRRMPWRKTRRAMSQIAQRMKAGLWFDALLQGGYHVGEIYAARYVKKHKIVEKN